MTNKVSFEDCVNRINIEHNSVISVIEYSSAIKKGKFKCNTCNTEWYARANSVWGGNGCPNCANLKRSADYRLSMEDVISILEKENCILASSYINRKSKMNILFPCGHFYKISLDCFVKGHRCPCKTKNRKGVDSPNWKGGRGNFRHSMNGILLEWKRDSMIKCDYKCVITGGRFDAIHHLYPFKLILEESLDNLNLKHLASIGDYSEENVEKILLEVKSIHNKYPLGVCLRKDIHVLFHRNYGNINFTPKDFEEFKNNFNRN